MRHARSVLVRWCKRASLAGDGDKGDKTGRGLRSGKSLLRMHLSVTSETGVHSPKKGRTPEHRKAQRAGVEMRKTQRVFENWWCSSHWPEIWKWKGEFQVPMMGEASGYH